MKQFLSLSISAAALVAQLLCSADALAARPDDLGTLFKVNDQSPKSNIPDEAARNEHPVEFGYYLQDLILRAEEAFKKSDWDNAVKYWDALAFAVPQRGMSFRRLCTAYEKKGDFGNAEGTCYALLSREGALVEDHLHFARIALSHFNTPNDPKVAELRTKMIERSVSHLRKHLEAQPAAVVGNEDSGESGDKSLPLAVQVELIACRLAALRNDPTRLSQCVTDLKRVNADAKLVAPFGWAAATASGDDAAVQGALKEARRAGLSEGTLKAMTDGTSQFAAQRALNEAQYKAEKAAEAKALTRKRMLQGGGAFAGLLSLAGLGWLFSRRNGNGNKSEPGPV